MSERDPVNAPRLLLRQLSTSDEDSVRTILSSALSAGSGRAASATALDRRTRLLVRLAALLVIDACTESLRWATDLACTNGADDAAVAAVLIAAGPAAGSAQLVAAAPRLALALGFDPPGEAASTVQADRHPWHGPPPPI